MKISILKEAIKQAEKSEMRYHVGAVIFKGSNIISTGFNEKRYCRNVPEQFKKRIDTLCAEKRAILNAQRNLKGCSILVVRMTDGGNLGLAKPCSGCQDFLKYIGINKIWYSTNSGEIVKFNGD